MGVAREMALVSSTIFAFKVETTYIYEVNLKSHVIVVIKTDLLEFVATMHSGLCRTVRLIPRSIGLGIWFFCFARTLVHSDNKPLQNRS